MKNIQCKTGSTKRVQGKSVNSVSSLKRLSYEPDFWEDDRTETTNNIIPSTTYLSSKRVTRCEMLKKIIFLCWAMAENYPDAHDAYQVGGLNMQKKTRATLTNDRICTHWEEYKQQG